MCLVQKAASILCNVCTFVKKWSKFAVHNFPDGIILNEANRLRHTGHTM